MEFKNMFDLSGRVAVITGGSGLLGLQYADILSQAGANVILIDKSSRCEEEAMKFEKKYNRKMMGLVCDITNEGEVLQAFRKISSELGKVDILINNAAITLKTLPDKTEGYFSEFDAYPADIWGEALAVNITGPFLVTKHAVKEMKKQKKGVIINISSTYGLVSPNPKIYEDVQNKYNEKMSFNTPVHYPVSKAAIIGFTRYLATHLAKYNIRANVLCPGGVYDNHDQCFVRNYSDRTPMGRMANKDDYQGGILFLASDASSYMTGAILSIDGGWTTW
jgi:NAD(P)-dependent dehydrogenase (short-subunit alcohol dehydrogenase family)